MSVIGIPYWGRTTERFLDLGFFDFLENVDMGNFPVGFGVWQGMQSIDTSCGIQIDGFSARTEPPGSISTMFMIWVFLLVFWAFWRFSRKAKDRLRVPKACPECFSEFIHPRYSKCGLKGLHLAPFGFYQFGIFVVLGFLSFKSKTFPWCQPCRGPVTGTK